ncbi:Hypothetical predicted protein [Xyrichtys novacula]|nr:Hypothetical predicted protein [Xyrichtys novacula]
MGKRRERRRRASRHTCLPWWKHSPLRCGEQGGVLLIQRAEAIGKKNSNGMTVWRGFLLQPGVAFYRDPWTRSGVTRFWFGSKITMRRLGLSTLLQPTGFSASSWRLSHRDVRMASTLS